MDCKDDPNYNLIAAIWLHSKLMVKEKHKLNTSVQLLQLCPHSVQTNTTQHNPNYTKYEIVCPTSINECQEKDAQNLPVSLL